MSSEDLSLLEASNEKIAEALAERAAAVRVLRDMQKESAVPRLDLGPDAIAANAKSLTGEVVRKAPAAANKVLGAWFHNPVVGYHHSNAPAAANKVLGAASNVGQAVKDTVAPKPKPSWLSRAGQVIKDNPLPFAGAGIGALVGGATSLDDEEKRKGLLGSMATGAVAGGGIGTGLMLADRAGEASGLDGTPPAAPAQKALDNVEDYSGKVRGVFDDMAEDQWSVGDAAKGGVLAVGANDLRRSLNPISRPFSAARRIEDALANNTGVAQHIGRGFNPAAQAIQDQVSKVHPVTKTIDPRAEIRKIIRRTKAQQPGVRQKVQKATGQGIRNLPRGVRSKLPRSVRRMAAAARPMAPPTGVTRAGLNSMARASTAGRLGRLGRLGLYGPAVAGSFALDSWANKIRADGLRAQAKAIAGNPNTSKQVGDLVRGATGEAGLTDEIISSLLGNDVPKGGLQVGEMGEPSKVTPTQRAAALAKLRQILEK